MNDVLLSGMWLACEACSSPILVKVGQRIGNLVCRSCGASYPFIDGVLVVNPGAAERDYPHELCECLAGIGSRHFWFFGRTLAILKSLRATLGRLEGRSVLDIGCGNGGVLQALEAAGMSATGVDMHMQALRHARSSVEGLLVCAAPGRVPFRGQFELVALCDVIEHVENDVDLLREARKALRRDGALLVTVPVGPALWSPLDELWGHKRRYTRSTLTKALADAGFQVSRVAHFNWLLLPLVVASRSRLPAPASDEDTTVLFSRPFLMPRAANAILRWLIRADVALGHRVPFGASLVATARPRP